MAISQQQFVTWSKPLSTTEDDKCKNAVAAVSKVIRDKFGMSVTIFLQGSYENNTNVRKDSDVDIVVRHDEYFYPNLVWLPEEDQEKYHRTHPNSGYTFTTFKQELNTTLSNAFATVKRKDKCIFVEGNSYRINADVVPCFVLKRFTAIDRVDAEGIKFVTDKGRWIESYPRQHYSNGVTKNNSTNRMFKRIVRILKNLRNVLIDSSIIRDTLVSSFFIECLVYNVANSKFIVGNYELTLRNVITIVYAEMDDVNRVNAYVEVSDLQYLFRGGTRSASDAKEFMLKCWQFAGF